MSLSASRRVLTVRELTRYLKALLESDSVLTAVWVRGEISNYREHYSGHVYFTLKDDAAQLRCVMFRSRAANVRFRPENGMSVIAAGAVGVFERDGQYQLYVEDLQPDGVGALHVAFEQLKQRLAAEGLFAQERKRPVPLLPRRIGVVTSLAGAALRDIVTVSTRRWPQVSLLVAPVAVQGEEAPPQIARAIAALNRIPDIDVIIVGRGGGSLEELWAFNDETVARAIFQSRVPVVSAVGHETDYTIADFVADLRAPTPSAAAECVVPDVRELNRHLGHQTARLRSGLTRHYERCRARLEAQLKRPVLARPQIALRQRQQTVDLATHALVAAQSRLLLGDKAQLATLSGRLQALSPLATLARGYAVCQLPDGSVVRDAARLHCGDDIKVRLARGAAACRVTAVEGTADE